MIKRLYLLALFCLLTQAVSAQISPDVLDNAIADEPAEYPEGFSAMMQFIAANIKLPESMVRDSVQGTCVIRFVVETDGSVGAAEILKSLTPDCDAEALRVVRTMKGFTPAVSEGKRVPVTMTIPVKFVLLNVNEQRPVTFTPKPELRDKDSSEVPAEYPGGEQALLEFINANIVYPDDALSGNIQGKVLVQFKILEDGNVGDILIKKGLYPSCDLEAARVIRKLGKFKPAMSQGKPVAIWFRVPIIFQISNSYR